MNRETTTAHVESWQFYSSCIEIFKHRGGASFVAKILGVSTRQVHRWACNPDFSESSQRTPMDRYETLLRHLLEMGRHDVAMGCADRQAHVVNCHLIINDVIPDKDSLPEELLDDLPVIAEFHTSAMNLDDEEIVRELFRKAENELKESFQAYLKEKQK